MSIRSPAVNTQNAMDNSRRDRASTGGEDALEAAIFMAELTAELADIARRHRFDVLAYLLEMARLEAEHIRHRLGEDRS